MLPFITPKRRPTPTLFIYCFALFQLWSCTKISEVAPTAQSAANKTTNAIAKTATQPNIILVLGDDIGYEVPTFTGGQSYSTPNLDSLAKQGMQFTNCYSLPMCSPSRFEMLTGKYNNRNYTPYSWGHLDPSQRTFANMLHDAGYVTCLTGKWQLDGGDSAIHNFGFDTYSVTNPFKIYEGDYDEGDLSLYKNPRIYQAGNYLPAADMQGKYGEDVNREFLFRFIDSNKNKMKPFFAVWTPNLCHAPFSPTPDDAAFASWDPAAHTNVGDTSFFSSMIKYFDKEMGMLNAKLKGDGLSANTVVLLVVGDNGTDNKIKSRYKGTTYKGGKGFPFLRGIHVPMIALYEGKIRAGKVNANIIDFTDFMPTLAELAKIPLPANYGILDGKSFAPQLLGKPYVARTSSFGYYNADRWGPDDIPASIYAFDYTYKLYEDTSRRFYNYRNDMDEKRPILPEKMTTAQKKSDSTLDSVIKFYMQ